MLLIHRFFELHARLEGRHGQLYALLAACVFLAFFVALPVTLTGLEDNVDGLSGYHWFYLGFAALAGLAYGAVAYLVYRRLPPVGRSLSLLLGLGFLLSGLAFAFGSTIDAGVLDNFLFAQPGALAVTPTMLLVDLLIVVGCFLAASFLLWIVPGWTAQAAAILALGSVVLSVYSLYTIDEKVSRKSENAGAKSAKLFHFNKEGRNILLVFLDGSMSGYLPDIIASDPGLAERFAGFTWYSNVVSTGNRTINGLPALFGGFDYTVSEINKRPGPLKDKVSDAYRVYVENFGGQGYDVLYSDPFWYGFHRKGDCELFNDRYEKSGLGRCIHSIGKFVDDKKALVQDRGRQFIGLVRQYLAVGLYKIAPGSTRAWIYGDGDWLGLSYAWKKKQDKYLDNYFSLTSLGELSDTAAKRNSFIFLTNEVTRAPMFLKADCLPDMSLSGEDPTIKPLVVRFGDEETAAIYQTTRCGVQAFGRYVDWMKENGVYDNTLVVIASDHGWTSNNPHLKNVADRKRYSMFQSFLMVKPFAAGATPLKESTEFIANANVPGLICEVLGGCRDPATGKTIRKEPLKGSVLLHETPWQPSGQTEIQFVVEAMHQVSHDVTQSDNWRRLK